MTTAQFLKVSGLCTRERYIYIVDIFYVGNLTVEPAKIFWSGRSRAVRLPKEFRFDTDAVRIWRHGSGLILEPIDRD